MNRQAVATARGKSIASRVMIPLAILGCLSIPANSRAQNPFHRLHDSICIPDCIRKWCCDDYCPKPFPCPVDVKCFLCDDYDPKRQPCPIDVNRFGCDDYCPKPFSFHCCPSSRELKCAPQQRFPWRAATHAAASQPHDPVVASTANGAETEPIESPEPPSP